MSDHVKVTLPSGASFEGSFHEVVGSICVLVGNTVGFLIPVPCPKCKKWSQISTFGGNVLDGDATCPKCGRCINN